jgi:hypothetical protein
MPVGIIYLITNIHNVKHNINPKYYIGSKTIKDKFDSYWGSSKYLSEDINSLGMWNFSKEILEEVEYNDISELLAVENTIQRKLRVAEDPSFYNKAYAVHPFYCSGGTHTSGTIWMTNGVVSVRVPHEEAELYLKIGFSRGRNNRTYNKDKVYINNGVDTKSIKPYQVSSFLENGWVKGRLKGNQSGKTWINKDGINKLVPKKDIHLYLDWYAGWKKI